MNRSNSDGIDNTTKVYALAIAAQYLEDNGYENVRFACELDIDPLQIFCEKDDVNIIVTVRASRPDDSIFMPGIEVTNEDMWDMASDAIELRAKQPDADNIRCDVIAVAPQVGAPAILRHLVGAFGVGEEVQGGKP